MNVLITSASRKVGLVRAFGRAVAGTGGRVIAADASPMAPALHEADSAEIIPRSDTPGFADAMLELCERDGIGLVIPTRDEELPVFARAREAFAARGVLVLVPDPEAVDLCQDKASFATACVAAGLETPTVVTEPTIADLPLFIRPRVGKGGLGARPVRSGTALAAAIEDLGPSAYAQELVEAPEFTIDLFIDPRDGTPISCVVRERMLVVAGESYVARTVRDDRLRDDTIRLADALRLTGHVTVQAFRRDGRTLFIEVNPRFGGGAALGFAAGAPTPEFAVRIAMGERVEPRLDDHEVGLIMLRYTEDRFVRHEDLFRAGPGS